MAKLKSIQVAGERKTRRARVCDKLLKMIIEPKEGSGERLPSVEALAERFNVGVGTMHLALGDLEARGYLVKKHGSGMFVASRYAPMTMHDMVAVCMESGAHLYGELWSQLMAVLQERQMIPLGIDIGRSHAVDMLKRLPATDIKCYFVQLMGPALAELFCQGAMQKKPVIAFFDTIGMPPRENLYNIRHDRAAMAQLLVSHLKEVGHRRLLILGTHTDAMLIDRPELTQNFAAWIKRSWEAQGGAWSIMESIAEQPTASTIAYDEEGLLSLIREQPDLTAIVGTRDVEAWEAQQVLRRRAPELAERIKFYGFLDTPWSRAGSPPFTTVSVNIPAMVEAAMDILDSLLAGKTPVNKRITIEPKLVVR